MSELNPFESGLTAAQRRQRTAAALALAQQLRDELMARPLPPPEPREPPIFRLVHYAPLNDIDNPREGPMPAADADAGKPEGRTGIQVNADDLKRLRRIVNLLTTAMGELNLWLANVGHEPARIEP